MQVLLFSARDFLIKTFPTDTNSFKHFQKLFDIETVTQDILQLRHKTVIQPVYGYTQ